MSPPPCRPQGGGPAPGDTDASHHTLLPCVCPPYSLGLLGCLSPLWRWRPLSGLLWASDRIRHMKPSTPTHCQAEGVGGILHSLHAAQSTRLVLAVEHSDKSMTLAPARSGFKSWLCFPSPVAQPSQLERENPNGPDLSKLLRIKGNNACKYLAQYLACRKLTSYSVVMNYQYLLT